MYSGRTFKEYLQNDCIRKNNHSRGFYCGSRKNHKSRLVVWDNGENPQLRQNYDSFYVFCGFIKQISSELRN